MKRKIFIGGVSFVALSFLFMVWYSTTYSMDFLQSYEKGNQNAMCRVLIASQDSEYKNKLVKEVMKKSASDSIYFKIIDVSKLSSIEVDDWDAILIVHTWEMWRPESSAKDFCDKNYDPNKMYVVSTSGSGDELLDGVDGVSSASEVNRVEKDSREIVAWLDNTLVTN